MFLILFLAPKDEEKLFIYLLSPSSRGSIMLRVESRLEKCFPIYHQEYEVEEEEFNETKLRKILHIVHVILRFMRP